MKKDYWIKSICLIMVIVLFAGLITAADDSDEECDAALDVINSDLIMYKCLAVNRIIEEYCIGTKLTYEQKEIALNSFHAEILPLSGKLIEKVDGVEYHYPKFLIDDGTDGYEATENTRYMISALDEISIKDYVSVYKGISVSAYELPEDSIDDAANIINKKIVALEGYGLTKEELNKRLSEFKKISAEYSGKVIYVDEYGNKYTCPALTREGVESDAETYEWAYRHKRSNLLLRWGVSTYTSERTEQSVTENTRYEIGIQYQKSVLREGRETNHYVYGGIIVYAYEPDLIDPAMFEEEYYRPVSGGLMTDGFTVN